MQSKLIKVLFSGCALWVGLSVSTVQALDPFSVYRENAPKNCIDKDIGKGELGLSELIEIGLCNNPALNRDYMSLKASEASLGKSKSEYLPTVTASGELSDSYTKKEDSLSEMQR